MEPNQTNNTNSPQTAQIKDEHSPLQSPERVYQRQLDFIDPKLAQRTKITVVGAGGIGSWTTFILAKLGCQNIEVWDDDVVEIHNLPSQFYRAVDIGKPKVQALVRNVELLTGQKIASHSQKFDRTETEMLIVGVDTMEERIRLNANGSSFKVVIDARMGGEQLEVYTVRDNEGWLMSLVEPQKAEHDPCTAAAISYNSAVMAGLIGSVAIKVMNKEILPRCLIFDLKTYLFIKS